MSGTRRTPIDRPPRPIIDAETVRLFWRGMKLESEGRGDEEFRRISLLLHRRLGLRPWMPNVFDVDPDAPDAPHRFRDWKYVTSLRAQLAELIRPRLVSDVSDTIHPEPSA